MNGTCKTIYFESDSEIKFMQLSKKIWLEDIEQIIASQLPWDRFTKKTILVSGANGFIPSYMVDTLVHLNTIQPKLNIRILALVRDKERAIRRFGKQCVEKQIELLVQDVCQPVVISDDIHYWIHAASQASPKHYAIDPVGTLKANVIGTFNLLEKARESGTIGFLFVSSGEVYGNGDFQKFPTAENDYGYVDPLQVRSCYAESKRMAENMCVSWHYQYGLPAKIVRPFHTYGPGLDLNDTRSQAEFVASVVKKRDIFLSSDGTAIRCFSYIADTISAFFTVLLKGENGHAYNVSDDGGEISIHDLAELIASLFPEREIKISGQCIQRGPDYLASIINKTSPDISKIRSLGWKPKTNLSKGFRRTIEAYL